MYVGLCRVGENFDRAKMAKCLVPVARRIMFCVVVLLVGGGGGRGWGGVVARRGGWFHFIMYIFEVGGRTRAHRYCKL
jgi:hypothetical protein